MKWLTIAVAILAVVAVLAVLAGRFGLLQGTPPSDLGVRDGRLKPPAVTPNSVSSQARLHTDHPMHDAAQIDPLPAAGGGPAALARIKAIVESMAGAQVVESRADYLYARFTTPLMRFVDDTEFWFDPAAGVVQVRSASRIGHGDHGLNRARIEAIRRRLASP